MVSQTQIFQQRYWQGLKDYLEVNNSFVKILKPVPFSWLNIYLEKGGIYLALAVNSNSNELYIWLLLDGKNGKRNFDQLYRIAYENSLIEISQNLIWDRMDGRIRSAVKLIKNADYADTYDWDNQFSWFKDNLEKFWTFFKDIVSHNLTPPKIVLQSKTSGIPEYKTLILPFLKQISDRREHKFRNIVEKLAMEFKVTPEQRLKLLPSKQPVFEYHVGCVRTHLKRAGLIYSPSQATFVITELGLQTLNIYPLDNETYDLKQFVSMLESQGEGKFIARTFKEKLKPDKKEKYPSDFSKPLKYKIKDEVYDQSETKLANITNDNISLKMTKKITRPASLVKQGDLTLYATSLKVSDLLIPNFYSIERLDPENASEKGYQRLLNKARAKKLADYIVAGQETKDAFLPTSIFIATEKNISFNPSNNTIDIDIDEVAPFNVVDGQHRVEGLKMACEKDARVLEFEVPVNIAINLPEIAQMCHFLIVNTTQKSVEEGVAQRIRARLTQALGVDDIPNLPKWILNSVQKGEDEKALQFVDFLNSESDSPWYNRIKMANEENSEGSINQKSFVKAIKKYVLVANNPVIATETVDKQLRIFLNYWKAITNIIGTEEPTVLFKYNGVELFCRFCVPFFSKVINMNDFKVATMQTLFEKVFDNVEGDAVGVGHTDFWVKGSTASGLNAGALSKISNEMVKALHKSSEIKVEKEV